jgi:hypothetical protein
MLGSREIFLNSALLLKHYIDTRHCREREGGREKPDRPDRESSAIISFLTGARGPLAGTVSPHLAKKAVQTALKHAERNGTFHTVRRHLKSFE